ncbi:hypothetical protein ABIE21_002112 [Conyzicola nivalis]|uniref:Uncharacterized protein n=1 Tax=Conyzicola nivalis TaxID=1477021 RepID=A0ABV2QNH4_9MICO
MKSITLASGTLVTGDAVAASLLDYVSSASPSSHSISVDIPVLEADGTVGTHTITLSAAAQIDVADAYPDTDEGARFPAPELPVADDVMVAVVPTEGSDEAGDDFNAASAEIDRVLDESDDS